ncbi:MAG: hypothetical protein ACE366_10445 [Bradymonadia bacterium]
MLFTMFYPAVKTAAKFNYPLDTVKDMMTLALWREAKRKHSTINVISLIFGKSTRTIKALSARFNKGGFFEETETNLTRRIEDMLSQRPMSIDELAERLPHSNEFDSTRLAVRTLLQEGRIEEDERTPGRKVRYRLVPGHRNLYCDANWEARIDGLSEHLEVLTETILQRFIGDEPDEAAARTFAFKARPEDARAFREELLDFIRARVHELEEAAEEADESRVYGLYTGSCLRDEED